MLQGGVSDHNRACARATSHMLTLPRLPALLATLVAGGILAPIGAPHAFPGDLFGYRQSAQTDLHMFPLWLDALERHLHEDLPDGNCTERRLNRCHVEQWLKFLDGLKDLPEPEQLRAVNRFANEKPYVLDIDNYGVDDYWAVAREFLPVGGDCEDYAITKLFSLRWLGYPRENLRIVIVQDTNLRVAHAVLAVAAGPDIFILDNQVPEVVSHHAIAHYSPVYSMTDKSWWIHLPQ
jgi:predicted transglutaminase-like cysteine proteinase